MDTAIKTTDAHQDEAWEIHGNIAGEDPAIMVRTIAQAIAEAEARGARGSIGHNQPPPELVPEKLIDPDAIPPLLDANYKALVTRGAELEAGIGRWKAGHLVPRPVDWPEGKAWPERYAIGDEATNNKTSSFLRQIASFAGGGSAASGEVNEAREKVKKPILASGKVVDGWFNNLRDGLRADVDIIDRAQRSYLEGVRRREQERRDTEAAAALEEASQFAEKARVSGGADEVVQQALVAEERAEVAIKAAEAPVTDLTRSRSGDGTTTSLIERWTFKVVDMKALVEAVAAGKVALQFVTSNDSVISAAVRAKGGLRECPGLEIINETSVRRTGRTS